MIKNTKRLYATRVVRYRTTRSRCLIAPADGVLIIWMFYCGRCARRADRESIQVRGSHLGDGRAGDPGWCSAETPYDVIGYCSNFCVTEIMGKGWHGRLAR
jgi:hypothetical protein